MKLWYFQIHSSNLAAVQTWQTLPYYSIYVILCATFNQFLVVATSEVTSKRWQYKINFCYENLCTVTMNEFMRQGPSKVSATQPANICSNWTTETIEQGVKYVQS